MVKRRSRSLTYGETNEAESPLCLCEYYNKNNERVHLLMCCCNCEALDSLCTTFCGCGDSLESGRLLNDSIGDIVDRLRVPWFGGARQLNWDFVISLLSIFVYELLGTINIVCSILTVMLIPLILYFRFFMARLYQSRLSHSAKLNIAASSTAVLKDLTTQPRNRDEPQRIQIAFFMILNSLVYILYLFNARLYDELSLVMPQVEKHLFNLLLVSLVAIHVYLHAVDPGFVNKNMPGASQLDPQQLYDNYCDKCNIKRAGSASHIGHCTVCKSCVLNRDHHCFWIDNCIGLFNHKLFLIYLTLLSGFFVYSFGLILKRLNTFDCHLFAFGQNRDTASCLFDIYFSNANRSLLILLFIQLMPLIVYINLLLLQQIFFISIGHTQQQLYRMSQKNYRFSLTAFIRKSLSVRSLVANWFAFLRFRNQSHLGTFKRDCTGEDHFI